MKERMTDKTQKNVKREVYLKPGSKYHALCYILPGNQCTFVPKESVTTLIHSSPIACNFIVTDRLQLVPHN